MSISKDAREMCSSCHTNRARRRNLCERCGTLSTLPTEQKDQLAIDRQLAKLRAESSDYKARYNQALKTIDLLERDLGVITHLQSMAAPFVIKPQHGHGTSEATPMLIASDWHMEQRVTSRETNGLNEYTLDIAHVRAERFFSSGLRLIRLLNQDVTIHTVVLALLGDFMTGQIHGAANAEKNQLPPTEAIVFAQNHLISGIEFFLNNSKYALVIPCKVGNHSRTTDKTRFGQENGHSFEFLMYLHLQTYFRNEPRVQFVINDSYLTYLRIYDQDVRLHHGHAFTFQGGVGGLFIPAYKRIDKWNKAKHVNFDVFGHWHQFLDGACFHCNGSLIGYDGRAEALGFGFEPPMQTLLLVDKKRGQTAKWPVLVEEGRGR